MQSSLRNSTMALWMIHLISRERSRLGPRSLERVIVLRWGWVDVLRYPSSIVAIKWSLAAICCMQCRRMCSTDSTPLPHSHRELVAKPILCRCSLSMVKSDLSLKSFLSNLLLQIDLNGVSETLGLMDGAFVQHWSCSIDAARLILFHSESPSYFR